MQYQQSAEQAQIKYQAKGLPQHVTGLLQQNNSTVVRDSDFNLSQTAEDVSNGAVPMPSNVTIGFDLTQGEALYSECKSAFMDLQKHKNDNNAHVDDLMREMQRMIDSDAALATSAGNLGDLSSIFTPEVRGEGANESTFIEPGPYYYSPHFSPANEKQSQ